jgi:hypothetical protein
VLSVVSACRLLKRGITFVGRNSEIISDTVAVGNGPPALPPSPFAPMGESIAIGVEDIMANYFVYPGLKLFCSQRGMLFGARADKGSDKRLVMKFKITCAENIRPEPLQKIELKTRSYAGIRRGTFVWCEYWHSTCNTLTIEPLRYLIRGSILTRDWTLGLASRRSIVCASPEAGPKFGPHASRRSTSH